MESTSSKLDRWPTLILVDASQGEVATAAKKRGPPFKVERLTEADYAWTNRHGLKIGIEEKRGPDMENSLSKRRLQRQLREMRKNLSLVVLGLRLEGESWGRSHLFEMRMPYFSSIEMAKWEQFGQTIFLPSDNEDVLNHLKILRNILGVPENSRSVLAGDDRRGSRKPIADPFEKAVAGMIEGIGPTVAKKLNKAFKGSLIKMLGASDEALAKAGAHKGIRARLKAVK